MITNRLILSTKPYIHHSLWLFTAWILIIFYDQHIFSSLYLSTAIAIAITGFALFQLIKKSLKTAACLIGIASLLCCTSMMAQLQFGAHYNHQIELIKDIIILTGGIALSKLYPTKIFEYVLKPFPPALLLYLLIQASLMGTYTMDSRFSLDNGIGTANTIAYLICFAIIILFYFNYASNIAKWLMITIFTIFLAKTFSRTAIFGFMGSILFLIIFHRHGSFSKKELSLTFLVLCTIILSFITMYYFTPYLQQWLPHTVSPEKYHPYFNNQYNIHRFLINYDFYKTHLSGRITAWIEILHTIWQNPKAWFIGFGPGLLTSINIYNQHFRSIDSFILKLFYYYGISGLIIACWFCYILICNKPSQTRYYAMKIILGFFMAFSLAINDTTSAAQALLYGILMTAFIFSKETIDLSEEKP